LSARFASNWLLPRLAQFRAEHPSIELTFDISDEMRDFNTDDIDVAIRFGAGKYEQTRSERLFEPVIVAVCSPKLLEAGARLEEPRDLLHHTLCYVDWKTDGMVWPNWRMWMTAAGIDDFDDRRCVGFSDSSYVVQAAIEANAVGLVDLDMISSELSEGRLIQLFDTQVRIAPPYAYYLVYPESRSHDSGIVAFRDWILDQTRLTISG
jgi:LysR family glycine cleavage system transcriptional activator